MNKELQKLQSALKELGYASEYQNGFLTTGRPYVGVKEPLTGVGIVIKGADETIEGRYLYMAAPLTMRDGGQRWLRVKDLGIKLSDVPMTAVVDVSGDDAGYCLASEMPTADDSPVCVFKGVVHIDSLVRFLDHVAAVVEACVDSIRQAKAKGARNG